MYWLIINHMHKSIRLFSRPPRNNMNGLLVTQENLRNIFFLKSGYNRKNWFNFTISHEYLRNFVKTCTSYPYGKRKQFKIEYILRKKRLSLTQACFFTDFTATQDNGISLILSVRSKINCANKRLYKTKECILCPT